MQILISKRVSQIVLDFITLVQTYYVNLNHKTNIIWGKKRFQNQHYNQTNNIICIKNCFWPMLNYSITLNDVFD